MEYITFREKNPSSQYDDYKIFTTNMEDMAILLQEKLIKIKTSTRN